MKAKLVRESINSNSENDRSGQYGNKESRDGLTPIMIDAIEALENENFEIVTTPRQKANGTIMAKDLITGTNYTIHKNGYARKRSKTSMRYGWMPASDDSPEINHYQLNKVKRGNTKVPSDIRPGEYFEKPYNRRVLLPGQYTELAQLVINAAKRERARSAE